MVRALVAGLVGALVLGVGVPLVLRPAIDRKAELALELRASGEPLSARVVGRRHRVETGVSGTGTSSDDVFELLLEGTRASGDGWTSVRGVDRARFEATRDGDVLEVVVLPTAPDRWMEDDELARRDAAGHEPNEASLLLASGLFGAAMGGFVAGGAAWRTLRR